MFHREYHRLILTVLRRLNANLLANYQTYLGGGALVSLDCGEHRLVKNLTFWCQKGQGYSCLRHAVDESGYHALFARFDDIVLPRNLQFHQHGFTFPVLVAGVPIKWQVLIQNQFRLAPPTYPNWSPVPCLNQVDCIAAKLLANSDRWNEQCDYSRDLIDLCALRQVDRFPEIAYDMAEEIIPVVEPLKQAITQFQKQPDYRAECYQQLQVKTPKIVIDGLDLLASDLGLAPTERIQSEWQLAEMSYPDFSAVPAVTEENARLEVPQQLPFLKAVCWQTGDVKVLTPEEMLFAYERGWQYRGILGEPSLEEQQFIKQLIGRYGSWLATNV